MTKRRVDPVINCNDLLPYLWGATMEREEGRWSRWGDGAKGLGEGRVQTVIFTSLLIKDIDYLLQD